MQNQYSTIPQLDTGHSLNFTKGGVMEWYIIYYSYMPYQYSLYCQ